MTPQANEGFDLVIEPGGEDRTYWRDLWKYRELFYFLSWRDILVRYKQTVLGLLWSVIRPLLTMIVFTFVFGRLAKLPAGGAPYPLLVLGGLLPWSLISVGLSELSMSLVSNSNLLTKVYFPRLVIPASAMITALADFVISLVIVIFVMIFYRFTPPITILVLPLAVALSIIAAMGSGLLLCALNVKYRDFRYIVPFIVQFGIYISPVGFSTAVIPERWRLLYSLNPAVGAIDLFRWSIFSRTTELYLPGIAVSTAVSIALLFYGVSVFRKTEKGFADII